MRPGIENLIAPMPRQVPANQADQKAYIDEQIRYWMKRRNVAVRGSRYRLIAGVWLSAYQTIRLRLFGERLPDDHGQQEMRLGVK